MGKDHIRHDKQKPPSVVKTLQGEVKAVDQFFSTCWAVGAEETRFQVREGLVSWACTWGVPRAHACAQGEGAWPDAC